MRPDTKRSEFEVHVDTPLELAGAEEGAGELERAIGKAKALGRDFGRLERQLARTREGIRCFHLAHPRGGGHGGEKDEPEKNEERKERQERKEMRNLAAHEEAGKGAFHRRSASRDRSEPGRMEDELSRGSVPMSPDPAGGNEESAETTSPRPEADAPTDGEEQSETGTADSQATELPEADGGSLPAAGRSDEEQEEGRAALPAAAAEQEPAAPAQSDEEQEEGRAALPAAAAEQEPAAAAQSDEEQEEGQAALPATAAEQEPAAAGWNAEAMRGEMEQIAREAVQQGQTAQAQRQNSRDDSRMAAMETRLRNLEQRLSTDRDL